MGNVSRIADKLNHLDSPIQWAIDNAIQLYTVMGVDAATAWTLEVVPEQLQQAVLTELNTHILEQDESE